MTIGLFDTIQHYAGCNYISDLQNLQYLPAIKFFVQTYKEQEFTFAEWTDLHYYLLRTSPKYDTAEEIRQALLDNL